MKLEGKIKHGIALAIDHNDYVDCDVVYYGGMTIRLVNASYDDLSIAFGPVGSYVDMNAYYTKEEIDNKGYLTEHQDISGKADKVDTYTKAETNTLLDAKANASTTYTKSEVDTLISNIDVVVDETDPIFTASAAYGITAADIANWNAKVNSSDLASVATSGSYNDLSDKPDIPQAQVQSDWNESDSSKVDYIKNKPTIPTVPSNVSAFNNDAGYLTTESDPTVPNHVKGITQQNITNWNNKVDSSDLANYYTKSEVNSAIVNFTPIIEDTRTSSVVAITGVAPFASLVDKQQILLHSKYMNSDSGAYTLNLTLSDNTTTGAKNIKYVSKTATWSNASGNMIRSGAYIHLIYDQTKDAWLLDLDYDTTYEAIGTAEINTGTATVGRLISAKLLRDNFYLKTEIDATIGDIETLLASI